MKNQWKFNNLLRESIPSKRRKDNIDDSLKSIGLYNVFGYTQYNYAYSFREYTSSIYDYYQKSDYLKLIDKVNSILKMYGSKIKRHKVLKDKIYFYIDIDEIQNYINNDYKRYEAEEYQKELDDYYSTVDELDLNKYKPSDKIIEKIISYRDNGSKVNVNLIKSEDKLLQYYWAACIINWKDLKYLIQDKCREISRYSYKYDMPLISGNNPDYEDILTSIERRAKVDNSYKDTRTEFEIKNNLPSSAGRLTFESRNVWLPDSFIKRLIKSNIPVHFGKRTNGSRFDTHNGRSWTEIENLTFYPGTKNEFTYDIAVHTSESMSGVTKYTGKYTGERVPFKYILNDINHILKNKTEDTI